MTRSECDQNAIMQGIEFPTEPCALHVCGSDWELTLRPKLAPELSRVQIDWADTRAACRVQTPERGKCWQQE